MPQSPKILILGKNGNLAKAAYNIFSNKLDTVALSKNECDVTSFENLDSVLKSEKPEIVLNTAAITNLDAIEQDPSLAISVNVKGAGNVAKVCQQNSARLVHVSSGMVFEGSNSFGYDETALPAPINEYGKTKLLGELEVQKYCQDHLIIRTSWLFGKFGEMSLTDGHKKPFPELISQIAKETGEVNLVCDEYGCPTFTHHLCEGILKLLEENYESGIYHLVNQGGPVSRYEWGKEVLRVLEITANTVKIDSAAFQRAADRPKYELLINAKAPKLPDWKYAVAESMI